MTEPLVSIENLRVSFATEDGGEAPAVRGVSFSIGREKLGIVGESGSGKSLSGRALMGVLPGAARMRADHMSFDGIDLLTASARSRRDLRGSRMAMVLQDPKFSLNPIMRVGLQIVEAVQIRDPERVFDLYPHELSAGMGQRVMIAMMVVREPDLLIADEPTSALDVTVQGQVLSIMDELVTRRGMGLILISHDLNLVSRFCDRVLVMYAGRVVEEIRANDLHAAQHPYTRGLMACLPSIDGPQDPLPVLDRQAAWAEG